MSCDEYTAICRCVLQYLPVIPINYGHRRHFDSHTAVPESRELNAKHLHHLVPQVIDHLYRNPSRLRLGESAGGVAVERGPGFFVDLGFESRLERAVGVVGAEEVGVTDEEAWEIGRASCRERVSSVV